MKAPKNPVLNTARAPSPVSAAWAALLVPVHGRWREKHTEQKHRLLRMDFATFRQAMINIPAQIIRSGRQTIYRLLSWNPWESVFFRLWNRLSQPLLC